MDVRQMSVKEFVFYDGVTFFADPQMCAESWLAKRFWEDEMARKTAFHPFRSEDCPVSVHIII